jgi:hypothetical protein
MRVEFRAHKYVVWTLPLEARLHQIRNRRYLRAAFLSTNGRRVREGLRTTLRQAIRDAQAHARS